LSESVNSDSNRSPSSNIFVLACI